MKPMLPYFAIAILAATPGLDANTLKGHMRFLASDALEGRGPATVGDELAQSYIESQFEILGLKPFLPDGNFRQKVSLIGVNGAPDKLVFTAGKNNLELKLSDDFMAVSGHQQAISKLEKSELVFVGYGIVAPEFKWDDFKGFDVKNKVLVVMNNDPETEGLFAGKDRLWYGRWDYKYEQAKNLGAAGCLVIHTTPSAGYPWKVVQTSWAGESFALPDDAKSEFQVTGWLTEEATKKVFALGGHDLNTLRALANTREFKPVSLGSTLSTNFKNVVSKKSSANVLGVLTGSDAKLKNEYVIITAHHDHLGKKENPKPGEDAIYNGAIDNASGVAVLLGLARALSALPKAPSRSIVFAAVAAEEQGLLGSQFLVEHSPVAHKLIAANLNVDGINIWGKTTDVSVIGFGKSSIDEVLKTEAKKQKRTVKPDALGDRGFFYRSDQFNFAKAGIPATYFSSGDEFIGHTKEWGQKRRDEFDEHDYHQPSDDMKADWDLSGAVEDLQLYFEVIKSLANAHSMPVWNKGDEFEHIRAASLLK
jgi:Zn-dependent M28 family amino/carboxypeptidase